MAIETLDIVAAPQLGGGSGSIALTPTAAFGSPLWIASNLGLRWRTWGRPAAPSSHAGTDSQWHVVDEAELAESAASVGADDTLIRLSMHGVLTAWRMADRALRELAEGSPEWAAVNATIISLRTSYRARFDEYVAAASGGPRARNHG